MKASAVKVRDAAKASFARERRNNPLFLLFPLAISIFIDKTKEGLNMQWKF